jgi:hypothetical protein
VTQAIPKRGVLKLNPETHALIVESVAACANRETAARAAGVDRSTLVLWLTRGRRERARLDAGGKPKPKEALFVELVEAVEKGEANAELDCVTLIRNAAVSNWTAAAWLLERKYPERFSKDRMVKIKIEGEQEAFLAKLERRLPRAMFDAVILAASAEDEDD